MAMVDGGRLFAKALKREGVEQVFTLTGGHIMSILYGCRNEGIKVIDVRHEAVAVNAAEAYGRITGKPGVLVTTAGPGVTNTLTGMAEAMLNGNPLIHIGGSSPVIENETGPLQEENTLGMMSLVSKWARKIYHVERIPEYVAIAFRHALDATPGPAYIECAPDILTGLADEDKIEYPENYRTDAVSFGDPSLVEKAADMLISAKSPAMLIGGVARYTARYGEAIEELANYLKMPVLTQTTVRGLFADESVNPLFKLAGAVPAADVVLILSATNNFVLNKLKPPLLRPDAKTIQVNPDITQIGYNKGADVGIVGGAGAVAKQILEAVKRKTGKQENDLTWMQEVRIAAKDCVQGDVAVWSGCALANKEVLDALKQTEKPWIDLAVEVAHGLTP
jgi:acetolactate synthase-1/2/3 large subunit